MRNRSVLVAVAILVTVIMVAAAVLAVLAARGLRAPTAQQKGDGSSVTVPSEPPAAVGEFDGDIPVEAAMTHLEALQRIADEHGGNRGTGETGYEASVQYVVGALEVAGYTPELHAFEVPMEVDRSELELLGDGPRTYARGEGVTGAGFMGASRGEATGVLSPVDLPEDGSGGSSGCERADFADLPTGAVALMQRGGCDFVTKARNAQEAGAAAVVVVVPDDAGGTVVMRGDGAGLTIPVVSVTGEPARGSLAAVGEEVRVVSARDTDPLVVHNVIAQTPWGDPDAVVVAGAHLDSVTEGPGISDNGSGSAALLAVAEHLADAELTNAVRFAWWGAEEIGLIGSTEYVQSLTADERSAVAAYLNMDMVASPNYVMGIYDGDDSLASGYYSLPPGSEAIERAFEEFFREHGLPYEDTPLDGRSDYDPFILAGIPSGGLFTGADEVKTAEQVELYGGTAGEPLDPCYHQPCDTLDNVDAQALAVSTNALNAALRSLGADLSGVRAAG